MDTFDYFYRKLSQATVAVLLGVIAAFVTSLSCAVLGLSQAVITSNGVTLALAYAFGTLLSVFLVASLVRALILIAHRHDTVN